MNNLGSGRLIRLLDLKFKKWALNSYLARVNYTVNNKYLLTASIRADGSSKFADGNQWGTFPSVSGAWRISNESFFPKDGIISDLKLRASWGMTGNQEGIGNYDSRSLANGGHNYNGQDGIAITTLANPDLKWEKSDQTNIGLTCRCSMTESLSVWTISSRTRRLAL